MNFNKYALVMFAFVGVISVMMGTVSSSYAQANQTMTTPNTNTSGTPSTPTTGNQTSTSASTNPTTTSTSAADKNNSSSLPSAHNTTTSAGTYNTSPQNTTQKSSGPMDMIKNLFKSFMGGNK